MRAAVTTAPGIQYSFEDLALKVPHADEIVVCVVAAEPRQTGLHSRIGEPDFCYLPQLKTKDLEMSKQCGTDPGMQLSIFENRSRLSHSGE